MIRVARAASWLAAASALAAGPAAATTSARAATETISEIRVQGNLTVPDAEVIALAGLAVGDVVETGTLETAARRLEATGRFEAVELRRRYRSLSAIGDIAIVVVVRERPGATSSSAMVRSLAGLARRTMVLPILRYDEGYGVSFGARTSVVEAFGDDGRLSVPATWGGDKRIALEADRPVAGRVVHRLRAGASVGRRRHPTFDVDDARTRLWVAVERRLVSGVRLSAGTAWEEVDFGGARQRLGRSALDLQVGGVPATGFPRDVGQVEVGIERIDAGGRPAVIRPRVDARGYVGIGGQVVLALGARVEGASGSLPRYERSLLGGRGTLRGWRVGARHGDRLAVATAELRFPLSSPLRTGTAGVRVFYDTGAVWDAGRSIRKARFLKGAGAGLFMSAALLTVSVDVAHDVVDAVRVHVGAGLSF